MLIDDIFHADNNTAMNNLITFIYYSFFIITIELYG